MKLNGRARIVLSYFFAYAATLSAADSSEFSERYIAARDGLTLYTFYMPAKRQQENAPTIIWCHGLLKHSQRFLPAMRYMAERGFNTIAFDARGHGRSGGVRGHMDNWEDHEEDLVDVCLYYKSQIKGDVFVVAHSMGSVAITRLAQKHALPLSIKKIVVTSPAYAPNPILLTIPKLVGLEVVGFFMPRYAVWVREGRRRCQTHDTQIAEEDQKDPYVIHNTSLRGLKVGMIVQKKMCGDAHTIQVPYHILASGNDALVDIDATKKFYDRLPDDLEKSIVVYPELYHSLLQEVGKERIFERIVRIFLGEI